MSAASKQQACKCVCISIATFQQRKGDILYEPQQYCCGCGNSQNIIQVPRRSVISISMCFRLESPPMCKGHCSCAVLRIFEVAIFLSLSFILKQHNILTIDKQRHLCNPASPITRNKQQPSSPHHLQTMRADLHKRIKTRVSLTPTRDVEHGVPSEAYQG